MILMDPEHSATGLGEILPFGPLFEHPRIYFGGISSPNQGILNEGEGTVLSTSLLRSAPFNTGDIFMLFYKAYYLTKEVCCT